MRLIVIMLTIILCGCNHLNNSSAKHPTVSYNNEGTRLKLVSQVKNGKLNLVFIPGGPGMDSSYLTNLTETLSIDGNLWLLDLPGNGSNRKVKEDYNLWHQQLINCIKNLDNVIVIGHSFGGSMIVANAELNKYIKASILISTPLNNDFYTLLSKEQHQYNLPDAEEIFTAYRRNPSEQAIKNTAISLAGYAFTPSFIEQGVEMLHDIRWNHKAMSWTLEHFFPVFDKPFSPTIPTLMIAGEKDHLVPAVLLKDIQKNQDTMLKIEIIKDAGHFPWFERPYYCSKIIRDFIFSLK